MRGYCYDCLKLDPDCICDTLRGQLIAFRKEMEWTQTDLANYLGYQLRQIQRWEAGTHPIPRVVMLALDKSADIV